MITIKILLNFFIPKIIALFDFKSDLKFKDFKDLGHFEPIFVDRFYSVKSFGESYRAFIVESDEELFIRELDFLNTKFKSGIISMSSKNSNLKTDIKFDNLDEIKVAYGFRYALILGDRDEILSVLESSKKKNHFLF